VGGRTPASTQRQGRGGTEPLLGGVSADFPS